MKVIYLGHSGFLVRTRQADYLFDYVRGELPAPDPGRPRYVFVSHSHADHFKRTIFEPEFAAQTAAYVLGCDIRKRYRRRRPSWMDTCGERILWAVPGEELALAGCRVLPLESTDCGVAYLVEEDGCRIYHAGDLNWWHWEGEPKAWNRNMEVNYKREIEKLRGKKIDVAFVPLDPRLGDAYWYGMDYFLRTVPVGKVFPMHFWEDSTVIPRYVREHGHEAQVEQILEEGQEFEL